LIAGGQSSRLADLTLDRVPDRESKDESRGSLCHANPSLAIPDPWGHGPSDPGVPASGRALVTMAGPIVGAWPRGTSGALLTAPYVRHLRYCVGDQGPPKVHLRALGA